MHLIRLKVSKKPFLLFIQLQHFICFSGKSSEGTTPLFDTPTTPHPTREAAEKAKQEAEAEERERMQLLVSSFTEDQLDRCFGSSTISMKQLCSQQVRNVSPGRLTQGNHQEGDADNHGHFGRPQRGDRHGRHRKSVCRRSR